MPHDSFDPTPKTDIEIANSVTLKPIPAIAERLGVSADDLEPYGKFAAKLPLDLIDRDRAKQSRLILVSAITPTPAGEGKTTVSIALTDGLNRLGKRATAVLREPSLGPVFGMKGGATGGGRVQIAPMVDINLHFTGDFPAIEKAHNLLAALVDNDLHSRKSTLGLDVTALRWKRVMDMNDRSLRRLVVGLGGRGNGIPREASFDITAASEVMAAVCLSENLLHLKEKLGGIFVGRTRDRKPVYARDLQAHGAMAVLLKDAVKPNLVQTLEGNPAIVHMGPFANIAQGTNSIVATRMGMTFSEYVVTEAGFGFDLGGEKFLDIKCRAAGLSPDTLVMVATVRGLKYQGGIPVAELTKPDVEALRRGFVNLEKHLENARKFGLTPVVAINGFTSDTEEEFSALKELCAGIGVRSAVTQGWAKGGEGALELAELVVDAAAGEKTPLTPLYDLDWSVERKIETVAREIYGAEEIRLMPQALTDLKLIAELGLTNLPICIAKTQKSFSDNPNLLGRPTGFTFSIREIEIAAGAGFLIPIAGEMVRMPGLPEVPASTRIDLDADGNVVGLS
jgi:formate--tetrahydrofolate ligase